MRVTTMLLLAAICIGRGIVAGAEPPARATPIALSRYVRGVVLPMDPAIFSPTECTVAFKVKVDKFTDCSLFEWGAQQERNRIVVSVGEAKKDDRGKLQFVYFDGKGVRWAIPGPEVPIGPLFFAFTFQGGQFRFYVNDKLAGTLAVPVRRSTSPGRPSSLPRTARGSSARQSRSLRGRWMARNWRRSRPHSGGRSVPTPRCW